MPAQALQGPIVRLLAVIDRIRTALIGVLPAGVPDDLQAATITLAAGLWLFRVTEGVTRLAARMAAGALKPLRARTGISAALSSSVGSGSCAIPMPRGAAWLCRALPEPEPLAATLAALLADPELQPLFVQEPARFGRLLRPLCRAMGLAPPEPLRREQPPAAVPATPQPVAAPHPPAKPIIPSQGDAALNLFRLVPKTPTLSRRNQLALTVFPPVPEMA